MAPRSSGRSCRCNRVRSACLGVSRFGQVGSLDDVYRYHGIDTDNIVTAALDVLP